MFVKYVPIQGKSQKPLVSLLKGGMISFNHAFRNLYLDNVTCLALYYDEETKRIGITPCQETEAGSHRLRLRTTGADIACVSFLNHFNIAVEETCRFQVERVGDIFCFSLMKALPKKLKRGKNANQ